MCESYLSMIAWYKAVNEKQIKTPIKTLDISVNLWLDGYFHFVTLNFL